MLPFTSDEETALAGRLTAMNAAALSHYVETAKVSLGNSRLDPSWRTRIEFGLGHAEVALVHAVQVEADAAALAAEEPPPPPPKTAKGKGKAKAAAVETETDAESETEAEADAEE